jgi:hypothetical protein
VFSVDGGLWLHQVLAWVVKHRPSAFIDIASVWTADPSPNFQFLGLEIVRNLPADLGATAVGIVTRYLMRPDIPLQMANQAITWIGSIPSRKVLEFLIEQGKLAEHQAAVADACRFLFPVFPDEVLKLIGQLAAQPVIRTDVREAIVNFYRSQLAVTGKYATQFFRSAIEAEPGKYQRDISRSVGRLRRGDPYVTEFVEEQLKVETDGETFEHYGYYLKQVRLLAIEDVPWLQRWIDSGTPTYGLLGYAAMSPLPTATKLELVAALDQRNPSFIRYCINSIRRNEDEALRKLAVEALNWPAYASLSARAQKWFALMAAGRSAYDAYDAVRRDR